MAERVFLPSAGGRRLATGLTALVVFAALSIGLGTHAEGAGEPPAGAVTTLVVPAPDAQQLQVLEGGVSDAEVIAALATVEACTEKSGYDVNLHLFVPRVEWMWAEDGYPPGAMSEGASTALWECEVTVGGEVLSDYRLNSGLPSEILASYQADVVACVDDPSVAVLKDPAAAYSVLRSGASARFVGCALEAVEAVEP